MHLLLFIRVHLPPGVTAALVGGTCGRSGRASEFRTSMSKEQLKQTYPSEMVLGPNALLLSRCKMSLDGQQWLIIFQHSSSCNGSG
jgi:hypothetical protein